MNLRRFVITVPSDIKRKLLAEAAEAPCSLTTVISVVLLNAYKPQGFELMISDLLTRTRLRNKRARVKVADETQRIGLVIYNELFKFVADRAKKNCRSVNGEILRALKEHYHEGRLQPKGSEVHGQVVRKEMA